MESRTERREVLMALDDLKGSLGIIFTVFVSHLWERLRAVEARLDDLPPADCTWEEMQRHLLTSRLARNGGNKMRTARELGVDIKTIYAWLNREKAKE
jgi:transcriptional regulator with PAS, ATPase and Fis domain